MIIYTVAWWWNGVMNNQLTCPLICIPTIMSTMHVCMWVCMCTCACVVFKCAWIHLNACTHMQMSYIYIYVCHCAFLCAPPYNRVHPSLLWNSRFSEVTVYNKIIKPDTGMCFSVPKPQYINWRALSTTLSYPHQWQCPISPLHSYQLNWS